MQKEVKIPGTYNYISAFLTMRCNLNCSFCLNSLDKSKEFNRKNFKEISGKEWVDSLNKIKSRPEVPITFSGGEPFLHKDFIYILNNLKPELNIDILTNLSYKKGIEKFLNEVNPNRIKRNAPYPSIRVSYHPEQMGNGDRLINNIKRLQDKGFSIGVYYVAYPGPKESELITQMQFRCLDEGIDYRRKDFTGEYRGEPYGNYSKYPGAVDDEFLKSCLCKTSELLISPNGDIYKCHRDLFKEQFSIGNITNLNFQIEDKFRRCNTYGQCHPCDVKVKTNYKQQLGHTSVEIKF
tara:strand:- start:1152 stop:2033 length:882 start_codon:yes stop_codon:yes gene_type:complete